MFKAKVQRFRYLKKLESRKIMVEIVFNRDLRFLKQNFIKFKYMVKEKSKMIKEENGF